MRLLAASVACFSLSGVALAQGFYFAPSPEGNWAYHSHKGSFSIHLKPGGECFVIASTEPDAGAQFLPCAWRMLEGDYIAVTRAGYRVKEGRQTNERVELPVGGSVMLQYDPRHDTMQMLGGPETWLRRNLDQLPRMIR